MSANIRSSRSSKSLPLADIASFLKAEIHSVSGSHDELPTITGIRPLDSAGSGDLSFVFSTSKSQSASLAQTARQTKAAAVLVAAFDPEIQAVQLKVPHPYLALVAVIEAFFGRERPEAGIHPSAVVHESVELGKDVHIGAYAVIGAGTKIGDFSIIHPHVVVYSEVIIGPRCEIHAGAVLREKVVLGEDCLIQPGAIVGGEGFGYIPDPKLGHRRIPHIGTVVLKDRVDLGANASVDRGTIGETFIDEATKLDSLVQIGHNNNIGKRVLICAVTGVGGSTRIGDDSVLGGHVGVADHITIGSKVRIGGKGGVSRDLEAPGDYLGCPLPVPPRQHWREVSLTSKLPELFRQISELESRLGRLEELGSQETSKPSTATKANSTRR